MPLSERAIRAANSLKSVGRRRARRSIVNAAASVSACRSEREGRTYRPDIDGLRALAVIPVLLFHGGVTAVPGGFVGVDVFFVISGYLITARIMAERDASGRIDVAQFWLRRVQRLAPALVVVLLATLLMAPFLLARVSGETGRLARAAIATILINANHFALAEMGDYFGELAETNPLLHMWSLAVEEQFYLLWPLLLLGLTSRHESRRKPLVVTGLLMASFGAACYWTATNASWAFYLMPARAWELLVGAQLALTVRVPCSTGTVARREGGRALVGLVLVCGAVLLQPGHLWFPGPMAVVPVAGSVLILAAGARSQDNWVSRMLSHSAIAYVGKLSYPLYLWHWPLLVMSRSGRLYEPSAMSDAIALSVAVMLSVLTYEFVERPAWRFVRRTPEPARGHLLGTFGLASSALVLLIAAALGAWARFGLGYTDEERRLDAARKDYGPRECLLAAGVGDGSAFRACAPTGSGPAVLLWGDSHANHWRPAIEASAGRLGASVSVLTMNGCRPLPGPVGSKECADFNLHVMQQIGEWQARHGLTGIVMAARWPDGTGPVPPSLRHAMAWKPGRFYDPRATTQEQAMTHMYEGLEAIADLAARHQLRVLIIGPSPMQRFDAAHCLAVRREKDCAVSADAMSTYAAPSLRVLERLARERNNVRVIDPMLFMCARGQCPVVIGDVIAYSDDDHVSATFARAASQNYDEPLAWLVGRSASVSVGGNEPCDFPMLASCAGRVGR